MLYRVIRDVLVSFLYLKQHAPVHWRKTSSVKTREKWQRLRQKLSKLHRSVKTESPNILERPTSRTCYMESGMDTALLYAMSTATSTTPGIATAVTITASTATLREGTAHRRIIYPTLSPSSESVVSLVTVFRVDSTQLWLQFD